MERKSFGEKANNLARFSWDLIKHVYETQGQELVVSDKIYKERIDTCKGCDKYIKKHKECAECGCYIPGKARIILDSCPLNKWADIPEEEWENTLKNIEDNINT